MDLSITMSTTVADFNELKSELLTDSPDFEKVRRIVSSNKELLNKPIGDDGEYVLHFACWKNAPSNIVIEFINNNPTIVKQKSNNGFYPLHYACGANHSEAVIQLLVDKYPDALQKPNNDGWYPLHFACESNQSESVIQLIIKEYPMAVQQKTDDEDSNGERYPLHIACEYSQFERFLLVLINLSLHAVKHKDNNGLTPLSIARENNQSSTIIKVLEELTTMSDYDLKNRIGIPTIVTLHGLDNLRRNDIFQWVLYNSPIMIDGEYIYIFI